MDYCSNKKVTIKYFSFNGKSIILTILHLVQFFKKLIKKTKLFSLLLHVCFYIGKKLSVGIIKQLYIFYIFPHMQTN